MIYKDKASHGSSPPCVSYTQHAHTLTHTLTSTYLHTHKTKHTQTINTQFVQTKKGTDAETDTWGGYD